jgi:hypothetical protein
MKTWKKVLLGIGAFIVIVIALAFYLTKGAADAAHNQLAAIRAGDAARAYALTSRAFQKDTSFEDFKKFITSFPPFASNESVSFSERSVDNGVGLLRGHLVARNGTRTPVEYRLVKEDGEWRIEGVKFDTASVQAQTAAAEPQPAPQAAAQGPPAGISSQAAPAQQPAREAVSRAPATDSGAVQFEAPPRPQPAVRQDAGTSTIVGVLISDAADETGYVVRGKPTISRKAPRIYVTVQVADARRGLSVSVSVMYLANNATLGPLKGEITADGNVLKAFSFTNSHPEWPAGTFRVTATLSDGTRRTTEFRVE